MLLIICISINGSISGRLILCARLCHLPLPEKKDHIGGIKSDTRQISVLFLKIVRLRYLFFCGYDQKLGTSSTV
ncbi:hypothetical protein MKW92_002591, partial [Papaver armeniacum]